MTQIDYYIAPSDKIFDEIKKESIKIWKTYDDTYGYATEKIDHVKRIGNYADNWGSIVGMFDSSNQSKLFANLSPEASRFIKERIWG